MELEEESVLMSRTKFFHCPFFDSWIEWELVSMFFRGSQGHNATYLSEQ